MTGRRAVRVSVARFMLAAVLASPFGLAASAAAVTPACGDTVGPGATLELEADLVDCAGAGVALTVVGPVILRMNGHEIRCDGLDPAAGIELTGRNVTISGGSVRGCRFGLRAAGQGRHRITDLHARSSVEVGVEIAAERCQLAGVSATNGTGDGIRIAADRTRASAIVASSNAGTGIDVSGDASKLTSLTSVNSGQDGVVISGARGKITGLTAATSGKSGVVVSGADNRLRTMTAARNGQSGILLTGTDNDLDGNQAVRNAVHGFEILLGSSNRVRRSLAVNNVANGFDVDGVDNDLAGNRAMNNNIGIRVRAGSGNEISSNTALDSVGTDLRDNSACVAADWSSNVFATANDPCIE